MNDKDNGSRADFIGTIHFQEGKHCSEDWGFKEVAMIYRARKNGLQNIFKKGFFIGLRCGYDDRLRN